MLSASSREKLLSYGSSLPAHTLLVIPLQSKLLDSIDEFVGVVRVGGIAVLLEFLSGFSVISIGADTIEAVMVVLGSINNNISMSLN